MSSGFVLRFFGPIQIERDNALLQGIRSRKAVALLGYLATHQEGITRAELAALFWPTRNAQRGLNNLSWVIGHLNHLIPSCLVTQHSVVQVVRLPSLVFDIHEFQRHYTQGDPASLAAAVDLYRGEFMQGVYLDDSPDFDLWLVGERTHWQRQIIQALEILVRAELQRGRYHEAEPYAARLLKLDPYREEVHRYLMSLLALDGQRTAALAQYDYCCRLLKDELGLTPEPETVALYEQILAGESLKTKNDSNLLMRQEAWIHLPSPHTSFVDRQEELAQIVRLFSGDRCRLVTLIGPGGIGKTRLALRAVEALRDSYAHGICIVPLAPVTTIDALVFAIAEALKLSFASNTNPQEQLFQAVSGRELLLVLDNVEQVLDRATFVLALLHHAARVCLLVTSRERLGLQVEHLLKVSGLPLPISTIEQTEKTGALRLFVERARQVNPNFALSGETLGDALRVCQMVEGSPLGIELAASWADRLTLPQIAAAIQENLDMLATRKRDVPERQRSMRAIFESSWSLLNHDEQQVLAHLAVFRGSFDQAAAQAVADAGIGIYMALEEQSLLRRTPLGRYELHELVRYYAEEKLKADASLEKAARQRHCGWYLERVANAQAALVGRNPHIVAATLRGDLDNLRQAWDWAVEQALLPEIRQSLAGLSTFLELSSLYQEGALFFERAAARILALAKAPAAPSSELLVLGGQLSAHHIWFLVYLARLEPAIALAETTLDLARRIKARELETEILHHWSRALMLKSAFDESRQCAEQALRLARGLHLQRLEASSLFTLGKVAIIYGQYEQGRRSNEAALQLYRAIEDRSGESQVLTYLGGFAWTMGDFAAARDHHKLVLRYWYETGQVYRIAHSLHYLADARWPVGAYEEAKDLLEQSIQLSRDMGTLLGLPIFLLDLARVLLMLGCYAQAADHVQEALRISRETGERRLEIISIARLGFGAHLQGDHALARMYCEQALEFALRVDLSAEEARSQTYLGHSLTALHLLEQADRAYQRALILRLNTGLRHLANEPLAGLARVAMARQEPQQALAAVETILNHMAEGHFDGIDEPVRVLLTCIHVLRWLNDPRADQILKYAHDWLTERSSGISDQELRRSFLDSVEAHRELQALHQYVTHCRS